MTSYPKSWMKVYIEEILAPLNNGKILQQGWSPQCERFSSDADNKWGVVKTTAIQEASFLAEHNKQLPGHLEAKVNIEIEEGDILMTCAGPRSRCGVTCLVKKTRPKLMMSGKMYRFRSFEEHISSRYLEAFLHTHEAKMAIDKMKTGINDSGLNLTHDRFKQLLVPIAPTKEQRRIVDKIDGIFSELDKGIGSLKTVREQLKIYRQSLLKHAFEGKLTEQWRKENTGQLETADGLLNCIQKDREDHHQQQLEKWGKAVEHWVGQGKKGKRPVKPRKTQVVPLGGESANELFTLPSNWKWASLSELSFHITDGTHKTPKYVSSGIPFISAKDIYDSKVSFVDTRFITAEEHSELIKRCHPKKGNVLVTKSGTIGRVAVVDTDEIFSLFESVANVPVIQPMNSTYVAHACYYAINGTFGALNQKGVAVRHLHLEDLRRLPVAIPPIAEQVEIIRQLDALLSNVEEIAQDIEKKLLICNSLRESILKKAFSGQLDTQNPNDEPASELLKHIMARKNEIEAQAKVAKAAAKKSNKSPIGKRKLKS